MRQCSQIKCAWFVVTSFSLLLVGDLALAGSLVYNNKNNKNNKYSIAIVRIAAWPPRSLLVANNFSFLWEQQVARKREVSKAIVS